MGPNQDGAEGDYGDENPAEAAARAAAGMDPSMGAGSGMGSGGESDDEPDYPRTDAPWAPRAFDAEARADRFTSNPIELLPKRIRDLLNHRLLLLLDEELQCDWLNTLPETREVMARYFGGGDLPLRYVQAWTFPGGGFTRWRQHQGRKLDTTLMAEEAEELRQAAGGWSMAEVLSQRLAMEVAAHVTRTPAEGQVPTAKWDKLQDMLKTVERLRRLDHQAAELRHKEKCLELKREKFRFEAAQARRKAGLPEEAMASSASVEPPLAVPTVAEMEEEDRPRREVRNQRMLAESERRRAEAAWVAAREEEERERVRAVAAGVGLDDWGRAAARPVVPVAKPVVPAAQPTASVAKPVVPGAKPAVPVARPAVPVPLPARSTELHSKSLRSAVSTQSVSGPETVDPETEALAAAMEADLAALEDGIVGDPEKSPEYQRRFVQLVRKYAHRGGK